MSNSVVGLLVGLILGLAAALGGLGAFLIVLVMGAVGFGVGRYLDGQFDDGFTGRNRRSGPRADR